MAPKKTPAAAPPEKVQIHPSIPKWVDERLLELMALDVYNADKYIIVNVALQYGLRHFKKASREYNERREKLYQDADDVTTADSANVVKLVPPNANVERL